MRIGLLGGSFDPPHFGHVWLAAWALTCGEVDQVLAVVCHVHPLGKESASFEHRLEMARRAFAVFGKRVQVSDIEREWDDASRTLRTLTRLKECHPDAEFRLVAGSDILGERENWYRFDEVSRLAPPLVAGRSGYLHQGVWSLPDISSSMIRDHRKRNLDVRHFVPAGVNEYITETALYQ